jgi:aspartate/methionine/tyrosine aminotransferase
VFDLAAKLKDPINLSIGQPDFDAPPPIRQAASRAIESRKNGYTVTQGIEPLREKIRARYGFTSSSEIEVFVSSGVSGGLLLSYCALLDPGDEVLIPDPFFCMYRDLAFLINAVPAYYSIYPDFETRIAELEAALTKRTKAIVVNTPGNPTGYAMGEAEVVQVIEFARKHDLWLIYDEIYSAFSYDQPHINIFGKYEKTIILNGFSKSHGIPGWRIGYVVAPKDVITEMLKVQQYTFVCSPSIVQSAINDEFDLALEPYIGGYKEKRDLIYDGLKDYYDVVKPGGAFYIFPRAPGNSGQAFVERCIENNLLVVPGNAFSTADTHFRISFSAPLKTIERGVDVLRKLAK